MVKTCLSEQIRSLAAQDYGPRQIAELLEIDYESVILELGSSKATGAKPDIKARLEILGDRAVEYLAEVIDDAEVHPAIRSKVATWVAEVSMGIKAPAKTLVPQIQITANIGDVFKAGFEAYGAMVQNARGNSKIENGEKIVTLEAESEVVKMKAMA